MIYYHKSREGVYLNQTSANLLPFVMSDPHTCITPQWQNMTVQLSTDDDWKRCDYGYSDDIQHYCGGELFFLSKTAAGDANSPGLLLMDYEIEFKNLNLTPRLLLWPQPTVLYTPYIMRSGAVGANTVIESIYLAGQAGNQFGNVANGLQATGIYKVIIDGKNSINNVNDWKILPRASAVGTTMPVTDGMTVYAVCANSNTTFSFYGTAAAAYAGSASELFVWAAAVTANIDYLMWFSLIGFYGSNAVKPNM
jgi:hypothetical protein